MKYTLQEAQEILHQLGIPREPDSLPLKKTWNRDCVEESDNWIIKKKTLEDYEASSETAKDFLKLIYNDQEYIDWSFKMTDGTKRKIARGANAKNWKENGRWICPSFHLSEKIYSNLGKKKWVKSGNHGKQRAVCLENQCTFITKQGKQCIRSCMDMSNICTHHFKVVDGC
tara:strand:- start:262 stop:774 length:513 start_codon:yes stop_codon:yes gene_type:complete